MVSLFGIPFTTKYIGNGALFTVDMFGIKVFFNCDVRDDRDKTGWRTLYIYTADSLNVKKDELTWEFVKSGYLNYVRTNFPRNFKKLITFEGWDRKLLNKRLERFGTHPKYNYLREDSKMALGASPSVIMSTEPGFYDFLLDID
jgi:hypothetical protein